MNTLNHLKGNFIISGVGIGFGIISKHFLKKEFIPVSSTKQIFFSYIFLTIVTIGGKLTMDKLYEKHFVSFDIKGKDKVPNEGFIGPLHGDLKFLMGPQKWDYLPDGK